jgi:hypothetical protein
VSDSASLFHMIVPFEVCWERIARAETHRDAIAAKWNAFIEDESYETSVYVEPNGVGEITIRQTRPVPPVLALEVGEFLYQLRAALDASIYELACVTEGKRPPTNEKKLEFPICTNSDSFESSGSKITPLTREQRSIVRGIQPYAGPLGLTPYELTFSYNRAMGILHDWARKDRHRKLHIFAAHGANVFPALVLPSGTRLDKFIVPQQMFVLKDEHVVATFQIEGWRPGMNIRANPNLTLDLVVDEVPPPCGVNDNLGQRLMAMSYAVFAVIFKLAGTVGVTPSSQYRYLAPPY